MSVTEAIEPSTNFDVERAEHLARIVDGHDSSQMNRVYQTGRFDHLTLEGEKATTKVTTRPKNTDFADLHFYSTF